MKTFDMDSANGFFEGWYFKQQQGKQMVALIPSFHCDQDGNRKAYLQIITEKGSFRLEYPLRQARASKQRPLIRLGPNIFSTRGVRLDIHIPEITCRGELRFGPLLPLRYDIMGPFQWVPFLQCSHGILSLAHSVDGTLAINGETYQFQNAHGYLEKDKGASFPKPYFWIQSNDFPERGCAVSAAVANIPIGSLSFQGCICVIYFRGKEYRLATYLGVRIRRLDMNLLTLEQGRYRLVISFPGGNAHPLLAPEQGSMSRTIRETSLAPARFTFWNKNELLFDWESPAASFEYVP